MVVYEGRRRSMKLIIFRGSAQPTNITCSFFPSWPWHDPRLSHVIFCSDQPRSYCCSSLTTDIIFNSSLLPLLIIRVIDILNLPKVTWLQSSKLARERRYNLCSTAEILVLRRAAINASVGRGCQSTPQDPFVLHSHVSSTLVRPNLQVPEDKQWSSPQALQKDRFACTINT